jgi:murein L,D-transpeptidase YcbB/YkuD
MRHIWMYVITWLLGAPQMRVAVNIPAYRLEVYVADSLVRTMPVAVGMPDFETPRGTFAISSVEWNPWWIPPDRPWAAHERPMPPGPKNPMGRVKLNFRPLYFLHGSPLAGSIGSAASHGCIRLASANAIELARLVHRFGSPALTADDVDRLVADTVTTRLLQLDQPIPLEIRYDRVEIRGGKLSVYRDVYGLGSRSLRDAVYDALGAYGVDTALVDGARVRALVRQVPKGGRVIPVDSLIGSSIHE